MVILSGVVLSSSHVRLKFIWTIWRSSKIPKYLVGIHVSGGTG